MRIARRLPGVMSACAIRVFRSFDLMRVVAIVMGGRLVCGYFCMVVIVRTQTLNVATRNRQQPNHDAARRNDAETGVNLWLCL